ERLREGPEPFGVGGGEVHADVVGRHVAPGDTQGAARIEFPRDPAPDLDGLQPAAEGLVERTFDQPLEPTLEPLESHWLGSVPGCPFAQTCRRRRCRLPRWTPQRVEPRGGSTSARTPVPTPSMPPSLPASAASLGTTRQRTSTRSSCTASTRTPLSSTSARAPGRSRSQPRRSARV